MTWAYKQSNGLLTNDGVFEGTGYSGTGDGRNNPAMQNIPNVGPIPQGSYTIGPAYDDENGLGPCVMHLDPIQGTETFGRSLFRIHGNNVNNDASHGCVILGPAIRHLIAASDDRTLLVTA
jgi:hypothetical protein